MEVLSRVKRFPFSRKDEASVSKYLQALGAKTTTDVVWRMASYRGPKLSGKTPAQLANAAGDFIMADTVVGVVKSIADGFSGPRFDFEKAEDDVWFADPPLKQLADMAESEGMSADDLIERLDAAKNSLRPYQGFGDEGDEIDEDRSLHLMTATRAKGKEFDTVILLDVNESMWPYKRAETPRDIKAERRLFYVAFTGAQRRVVLLSTKGAPVKQVRRRDGTVRALTGIFTQTAGEWHWVLLISTGLNLTSRWTTLWRKAASGRLGLLRPLAYGAIRPFLPRGPAGSSSAATTSGPCANAVPSIRSSPATRVWSSVSAPTARTVPLEREILPGRADQGIMQPLSEDTAPPTTGRRRIVWLASWPRSGNSWLRPLLANFLADADAAVSFGEVSARIDSGLYGRSEFDGWTDVPSECCTDEEADLLRPAVCRAHAAQLAHAGRGLFIRIHDAFLGNGAAEPLFPDDVTVGAIYLVRNPLDVAVSWAYYADHGDVARGVAMLNDPRAVLPGQGQPQLRQRLLDWSGHIRSWTGAPFPVLVVRYEDLLADTAGELGRIVHFLRLAGAAEAPRLRRAVAFSAFARLRG